MAVTKVTVSLDPAVAERARRDVAEGKAKSVSAWLNDAGEAHLDLVAEVQRVIDTPLSELLATEEERAAAERLSR